MSVPSLAIVCPHCDASFPIEGRASLDVAQAHVMAHLEEES